MDSQIPDAAYASQPPIVKTRLASRSTASWHYGRPSCAWWSTSLYVFGNTAGQVYTRSGWNTSWSRLMDYCEIEAKARGIALERFSLRDMRPAAVTDREEEGDNRITDATGHSDDRMVNKVYDRRRQRKVRATR